MSLTFEQFEEIAGMTLSDCEGLPKVSIVDLDLEREMILSGDYFHIEHLNAYYCPIMQFCISHQDLISEGSNLVLLQEPN